MLKLVAYLKNKLSITFIIFGALSIVLVSCFGISTNTDSRQAGLLQGHAYQFPLNVDRSIFLTSRPDTDQETSRSSAILIEDGVPLLKPHTSVHLNIIEDGAGRYSHWKGIVYFSSSDNTNPLKNGRSYQLLYKIYPTPIGMLFLFALVMCGSLITKKFNFILKLRLLARSSIKIENDWMYLFFCICGMCFAMFLYAGYVFPKFDQLNQWDEVTYLASGMHLVENGTLWPYSRGPLISLFYALIYYPATLTDNWLLSSAIIGRVLNFIATWAGLCAIGKVLDERRLTDRYIFLGMSVIFPVYVENLVNPSYAIFTTVSIWAVYFLVKAGSSDPFRNLLLSALFIALGGLTRPEIFITLPVFLILVIVATKGQNFAMRARILASAAAIVFTLIGGYLMLFNVVTGQPALETSNKLYVTFEASESLMLESTDRHVASWLGTAQERSRKLYGTPEENGNSVLRAVLNNPNAYLQREIVNMERASNMAMSTYGQGNKSIGFILLTLSVFGAFSLFYQRKAYYGYIFLLWQLTLSVYLATIIFPAYLIMPFFCILALASIGVTSLLKGLRFLMPNQFSTAIPRLFKWKAIELERRRYRQFFFIICIGSTITICSLLAISGKHDKSNERLMADFLSTSYSVNTKILAYPGTSVELAKMSWVGIAPDLLTSLGAPDQALNYLADQGISAVIVEPFLTNQDPFGGWTRIKTLIDTKTFILRYMSEDAQYKVFVPNFDYLK